MTHLFWFCWNCEHFWVSCASSRAALSRREPSSSLVRLSSISRLRVVEECIGAVCWGGIWHSESQLYKLQIRTGEDQWVFRVEPCYPKASYLVTWICLLESWSSFWATALATLVCSCWLSAANWASLFLPSSFNFSTSLCSSAFSDARFWSSRACLLLNKSVKIQHSFEVDFGLML